MDTLDRTPYSFEQHKPHLTDGRWHHDCPYCHNRRLYGATGLLNTQEESRAWCAMRAHRWFMVRRTD